MLSRTLPDGARRRSAQRRRAHRRRQNADAELGWAYDLCGRVVAETANGRSVANVFDPAGNRISRTSPLGRTVAFEYDPEGRLLATAEQGRELFRSTWDPVGRERKRVATSGTAWEWDFLPTGELTAVRVRGKSSFSREYVYDKAGRIATQEDSVRAIEYA